MREGCSAAKSKSAIKSALTPLAPTKISSPPQSPLPAYRAISPPPPIYTTPKTYLTIADLYMRYAPLNRVYLAFYTASRPTSCLIVRDLYERFHGKEKPSFLKLK